MRCNLVKRLFAAAASFFAAAFIFIGCSDDIAKSPDIPPHLIAEPDANYTAPIEARPEFVFPEVSGALTDEQYRARVELLYTVVVYDGMRPVLSENDPVKPIYDGAKKLLARYIVNDWHEKEDGAFEIVHAIHDYLVTDIDYDFVLYSRFLSGADVSESPAFHIDGVLLNKLAVCDGLSRAFVFLCAVEGIDALRVTGSFGSSPHAWNKVKLFGEWYNIDVTSDAVYYSVEGVKYKQLSHGFFLISDRTAAEFKPTGYDFLPTPFVAERDFDYYDNYAPNITVGGAVYSPVITSENALVSLFGAISEQKGRIGKIELKLDFPGKAQTEYFDAYSSEIAAAYGALESPGFSMGSSVKPYFRFPGGVYLFLMYT